MKIALIIVRTLLGLLFLFGSVTYFFNLIPPQELNGNMKLFMEGMVASVYLLPLVKAVELICGLCFITGKYVTLAAVVIFPITLNILMLQIFLSPEGLPMAIVILLMNLFIAYYYRRNYSALYTAG